MQTSCHWNPALEHRDQQLQLLMGAAVAGCCVTRLSRPKWGRKTGAQHEPAVNREEMRSVPFSGVVFLLLSLFFLSLPLFRILQITRLKELPPGKVGMELGVVKGFCLGSWMEFFPSWLPGISSFPLGTSCYLSSDSVERLPFSVEMTTFDPTVVFHSRFPY